MDHYNPKTSIRMIKRTNFSNKNRKNQVMKIIYCNNWTMFIQMTRKLKKKDQIRKLKIKTRRKNNCKTKKNLT